MPLYGYMQKTDPGRISSITNVDGDKNRRKRIIPLEGSSKDLYVQIMVRDCISHDPPGAVVPVILRDYDLGIGWVELGQVQCCPLCWTIINPSVAGLPEAMPQLLRRAQTKKQKVALTKGRRKVKKEGGEPPESFVRRNSILKYIDSREEFSVYDIMDHLDVGRQTALKYISALTRQGKIVLVHQGAGRGDRTTHRKAP